VTGLAVSPADALETRLRTLTASERATLVTWLGHNGAPAAALPQENPWALVLAGVLSWEHAETWGTTLPSTPARVRARVSAATMEVMRTSAVQQGHTARAVSELPLLIRARLGHEIPRAELADAVQALVDHQMLTLWNTFLALPTLAAAEARIVKRIARHLADAPVPTAQWRAAMEKRFAASKLSTQQRTAALAAVLHPFAAITGPAGSGKTVVIRELVHVLEATGDVVVVGTPTGKAAEVLVSRGVPQATTLHALLGLRPEDTPALVTGTRTPIPVRAKWLIIDEATQLDLAMWDAVWSAVRPATHVIAIGDIAQLAPVGPGSPFEDFLAMPERLSISVLDEVHRTSGRLTQNALAIREGRMPAFDPPQTVFLAPFWDARNVPQAHMDAARESLGKKASVADIHATALALWLVELVAVEIPARLPALHPARDIQVLVPQAPGPLGTIRLNTLLRDRLNPATPGVKETRWWYAGRTHFARAGDQVIATTALSDEIRNGAVGVLQRLDDSARLAWVKFAHRHEATAIRRVDLQNLTLRYALTVHRMQGSETEAVIQVLHESHNTRLLTRRSMYTGATRARTMSGVLAIEEQWLDALARTETDVRTTTVCERLRLAVPPLAGTRFIP